MLFFFKEPRYKRTVHEGRHVGKQRIILLINDMFLFSRNRAETITKETKKSLSICLYILGPTLDYSWGLATV